MHMSARILLPKGYEDNPDLRYPLIIHHGHFSIDNPGGFVAPGSNEPGNDFYDVWTSEDYPRFLLVTLQHPTPYFDDSYGVNSDNMGPYGDAIATWSSKGLEESEDWIVNPGRLDLLDDHIGWVPIPTHGPSEAIWHAGGEAIQFNLQISSIDVHIEEANS